MTTNSETNFGANVEEIIQILRSDNNFQFTDSSQYLLKGICPSCGKKELFISKKEPWQLKCSRLNKCGYEEATRNLYPQIFANFSKRYPATEKEPNATASAFLSLDRGFDLSKIRGWYEQQAFHIPGSDEYCNTVRFYIDKDRLRYWERLIDKTKKDGQKANFGGQRKEDGSLYRGDAWCPPDMQLKKNDKCFIVEGIFHAIALYHHGIKAVAAFSCNNFPSNFVKEYKGKGIVWIIALDGDKAGLDYTSKHVKKLRAIGEKVQAYRLPEKQDWDDLHRAGKITNDFLDLCEHRGKLLIAETVEEHAYIKYCRYTSRKFVISFRNRLFSVKIDIGKLTEELHKANITIQSNDGFMSFLSNCEVLEICNRDPQCLYREVDEILAEQWYVFKINSPKGEPEIVRFEGTNIASADAFHKALLNRTAGGLFNGTPADMRILTGRWLKENLPVVRSIPYIGYDNESEAYIFPSEAFYKGREITLNDDKFFNLGRTFIRPGLKSISISSNGNFDPVWLPDYMRAFHWQGVALLSFWLGSLFIQQIRKEQKSFPFFEFTGDPGAGKSTVLEFLWKLVGREGYEGFDVMKATVAGRRRAFNQVSNLPIVIIESDRDSGISDSKQRQFNFDECKPFYNGRGTGTLGVARRNNDVDESLFQASLIISQNAEVDGSEALLQRIVHCHADKSHHRTGTREIARSFERKTSEDVSGFLKAALKNEKIILETYFQAFDRIEQQFSPLLRNERIAKNYAQVAACGAALKVLFPSFNDQNSHDLQNYLLKRAVSREERLAADHPMIEQFWETYRYLNSETNTVIESSLNHSNNPDLIAINLNHFIQRCRENGQESPDMKILKKLLPHSKKHELIERSRPMKSRLNDKTVRCWIFKA